ncbi:MAG: PilZ domain-containing protein [Pseudomonadota bacterium]
MEKNRRRALRATKRLKIEYGVDALDKKSVSYDISVGGLFLVAPRLLAVNTRIHLHIFAQEGDFYAEGIVVRLKHVTPGLQQVEPQGMGIRFLSPAEVISANIPRAQRRVETQGVQCATVQELQALLRDQLGKGILLVPVTSPTPEPNSVIEFDILLGFVPDSEPVTGQGRVVQLLETVQQGAPLIQAVLEVLDVHTLCATLEKAIA